MRCCPDAFLSLRSCAIEVIGVSGSLPIFGIGTAMFVVRTSSDLFVVALLHNCLLSQGSPFNLLSVSQFQTSRLNSVDFRPGSPNLSVKSPAGHAVFPLALQEGLYSFLAEPLHPSDDRYRSLPRFDLTPQDSPFSTLPADSSGSSSLSGDENDAVGAVAGCLTTVPCFKPPTTVPDGGIAAGDSSTVTLYDVRRSSSAVPLTGPLLYPSSLGQ
jgi:hypothetical protein